MLKKDWMKNIGLAIDRKNDNCPYEGIECECPNGTYLCSKCIEILMNNHDKEVRNNAINEFYNLLINNTGDVSDVGGVISEQRIDALYEQMKRH